MDSNNATRALLCKCFDHLNQEIARLSLNESAASGTQALSREIAEHLDALAAQQSVPLESPVHVLLVQSENAINDCLTQLDVNAFTHEPVSATITRAKDVSKRLRALLANAVTVAPVPPEARAVLDKLTAEIGSLKDSANEMGAGNPPEGYTELEDTKVADACFAEGINCMATAVCNWVHDQKSIQRTCFPSGEETKR